MPETPQLKVDEDKRSLQRAAPAQDEDVESAKRGTPYRLQDPGEVNLCEVRYTCSFNSFSFLGAVAPLGLAMSLSLGSLLKYEL